MKFKSTQQKGFALLLTLIVVSVVLSVGLSLLDITIKQLTLSGTTRDSEIAFHAAYVGTECAEYWARDDYTRFLNSTPVLARCIDDNVAASASFSHPGGESNIHKSQYEVDWVVDSKGRCTQFDVVIFDAYTEGADLVETISDYPQITCKNGRICTYTFSRGYNRACSEINSLGTVQREIVSNF